MRLGIAAVVFAAIGGSAPASTIYETFYFSGHRGLVDEKGGGYSYEENGLSVTATGHILNEDGSIGADRWIGEYWGGLGVTTYNDTSHEIDSEGHRDEVVKLSFSKTVKIEKLYFTLIDSNDDFSFTMVDGEDGGSFYGNVDPNLYYGGGYAAYDFHGDWYGTMFGIGAADKTCKKWKKEYSCDNYDNYKLKGAKVSYKHHPAPVPLPAAGWMLLAGIGGVVALKRREKNKS